LGGQSTDSKREAGISNFNIGIEAESERKIMLGEPFTDFGRHVVY
jgi:hypothetical protein